MKRVTKFAIHFILIVGLVCSQSVYASVVDNSTLNQENTMKERNQAIAHYLECKISNGSLLKDDTAFFSNNPQYIIENSKSEQTPNKVDSILLNLDSSDRINDSGKITEVDFYSDGSYIISELEKKIVPCTRMVNLAKGPILSPINMVLGQNTHHIYNTRGQYIGRSYVEANFSYDGTKVGYGNTKGNARSLLSNYRVEKYGNTPSMSYPPEYNGLICRAQYTSFFFKKMPTGQETQVLMDINRVSCNHQGKIYRTNPSSCI